MIDQEEENNALHNSLMVVVGDIVVGHRFYGPFPYQSYEEVCMWADKNLVGPWWIMDLIGITNPNHRFDNTIFDNGGSDECTDLQQLLLPFSPPSQS